MLVMTHDLPFAADDEGAGILAGGRVAADGPAELILADAALLAAHGLALPAGVDLLRVERRGRPARTAGAAAA